MTQEPDIDYYIIKSNGRTTVWCTESAARLHFFYQQSNGYDPKMTEVYCV